MHAPAAALAMAGEQVIQAEASMMSSGFRPRSPTRASGRPGGGAGAGQQRQLQRGEVTHADKLRAALHRLGQGLVPMPGRMRVMPTAAADQRHVGTAGGRAVDGGQARGIVAGKARMAARASWSTSTSWPMACRRLMPRRNAALSHHRARGE